jgi:hypothetical protein
MQKEYRLRTYTIGDLLIVGQKYCSKSRLGHLGWGAQSSPYFVIGCALCRKGQAGDAFWDKVICSRPLFWRQACLEACTGNWHNSCYCYASRTKKTSSTRIITDIAHTVLSGALGLQGSQLSSLCWMCWQVILKIWQH